MKNKINRFCLCLISALLCLCLLGGCAGGYEEASRVSTTVPVSQDQDESAPTENEAEEKETVKAREQDSTSKAQSTAEKSYEASGADKKATAKASTTSAKKKTAAAKKASSSQKEKTTAPSSAKATTAASEAEYISCTVEIECKSILGNMDSLKKGHEEYIPSDGVIMSRVSVTVKNKSSVYDAVMLACEKQGVSVNSVNSAYGKYIAGFNNIDEKDCGAQSGWMYTVNGSYPSKSCDKYILKSHDSIVFTYTC
ncbi:MAG: DUF4430 domain-containing protein [Eubacterium sp.]